LILVGWDGIRFLLEDTYVLDALRIFYANSASEEEVDEA